MKSFKRGFVALSMALAFTLTLSSCDKDDDVVVPETELSAGAKAYVNTHFSGVAISQIIKDKEGLSHEYEVILANGVKLEFNANGEVESIKSLKQLPDSVIPAKILTYVKANYPAEQITEWESDVNDQEVQLTSGMELKFSKAGDFLRIDI
ncbi:PepSY-like domain-containing protein [Pedobacter steynii]|uniref:Putative beta-lactamase-inhibitor-like PepSY-like domain-containing protein n=1 Tax=Pedobacter steynii TaxID=430522 RepID=A0A1D7QKD9_9SPHI|nr:PepSY-like domain-containing protein [Pedobacter steynii]AOM79136.1 hypothetical protein BFS30_19355 [Pedobacter steynii]